MRSKTAGRCTTGLAKTVLPNLFFAFVLMFGFYIAPTHASDYDASDQNPTYSNDDNHQRNGHGEPELIVYHPPTEPPTYIDQGLPGDSVGDVRIFHFEGETGSGEVVETDWIMTTTGIDTAEFGAESRVTTAVFAFTDFDKDQIVIEGVGLYPVEGDTFVPNSMLVRAITGGTGRFKGATGEVISIHLVDGSWMHVFDFDDENAAESRDDRREGRDRRNDRRKDERGRDRDRERNR